MNTQKLNEEIAKDQGWKPHPDGRGFYRSKFKLNPLRDGVPLPDYCHSLDAMAEVIHNSGYDANEMLNYLRELKQLVAPHYLWDNMLTNWGFMNATALHRAIAYCRAKNLQIE